MKTNMGGTLKEWLTRRVMLRLASFDLIKHTVSVSDEFEVGNRIYTIRPFLSSDMVQILPLIQRLYEEEMAHLTGGAINDAMLSMLERSAENIHSAFSILEGGRVCGFVKYLCWTHVLRQEKILENTYAYVVPEHRSFKLFRRIVRSFEQAGSEIGVDRILFGFETGKAQEVKRIAMEKMGFSRLGAYMSKHIDTEKEPQAIVMSKHRSRPSLATVRYLYSAARLSVLDFLIYLFCSYLIVKNQISQEHSFFELTGFGNSYLMAWSITREFDNQKLAVVLGVRHPNVEMVQALESWAASEGCVSILVNTLETMGDACVLFENYALHGFVLTGHIMSKCSHEASA